MIEKSTIIIGSSSDVSELENVLEDIFSDVRVVSSSSALRDARFNLDQDAIICIETDGDYLKVDDMLKEFKDYHILNPVVLFDCSKNVSHSSLSDFVLSGIKDLLRAPYFYHVLYSRLFSVVKECSDIQNKKILIVDDDELVLKSLRRALQGVPYECTFEKDPLLAIELVKNQEYAVVVSDIQMPEMDGIEFLARSREFAPEAVRIVLSGTGEISAVVQLVNHGNVWRYIEKPWDFNDLIVTLKNAVELFANKKENIYLRSQNIGLKNSLNQDINISGIVSESPLMHKVFKTIEKVANLDSLVLIQGESGTGKEIAAQAVHYKGSRSLEPFVVVDCGALSPTLFESELFGHTKGAFTGAQSNKKGLLEKAGKGTIFFDEIGELPLEMQTRLLRAIQEKQIRPVGATEYVPLEARIVAATNRDLKAMVGEGTFREDLFYRLQVIAIALPALRNRKEDIPALIEYFINRHTPNGEDTFISSETIAHVISYSWPGNIRELENAIIRATALADNPELQYEDILGHIDTSESSVSNTSGILEPSEEESIMTIEAYEKLAITRALEVAEGNRKRASEIVGIGEATLYRKLKEYGL